MFPQGPPLTYLPMPVPDPEHPWGNSSCEQCSEAFLVHMQLQSLCHHQQWFSKPSSNPKMYLNWQMFCDLLKKSKFGSLTWKLLQSMGYRNKTCKEVVLWELKCIYVPTSDLYLLLLKLMKSKLDWMWFMQQMVPLGLCGSDRWTRNFHLWGMCITVCTTFSYYICLFLAEL